MTGALPCIKNGNMPARKKEKKKRQHVAVIGLEFIIFGVGKWGCIDFRKTQRSDL